MPAYGKLFALALVTAVLTVTVRKQSPEQGLLLSLAGCLMGAILLLGWIRPVINLVRKLSDSAGLDPDLTGPMMKVLGIGLLTQVAASVCSDAGQTALAKLLELGGSLLALCLSLPLLEAVLVWIEDIL